MPAILRRDPDGIPHAMIAISVLSVLVLAAVLLMIVSGHVMSHPGALLLVAMGAGSLVLLALSARKRWRHE